LTDLGEALRGPAGSLAAFIGRPNHWTAWGQLLHSVRTGENAFAALYGTDVWSYRAERPESSAVFDAAMAANTAVLAAAVTDGYEFDGLSTVVDVGGGNGALLVAILTAYPHLTGILFDQPHVIGLAELALQQSPVGNSCRAVGGSMFETVPTGGDTYLLKHVLHDWPDDEAVTIIDRCRQAMSDASVLVVIERLLAGPNEGAETKLSDLNMLVMPDGRERSEAEFAALFERGGLRLRRTLPVGPEFMLEAVKA
jgi:hypothetical protein